MRQEFIVLFSVLLVTVFSQRAVYKLTPEVAQELLQAGVVCMGETSLTPDNWASLLKGDYEENEDLKKFLFCLSSKMGFTDAGGYPVVSKLYETFKEDELRQVIDKCVPEAKGSTPTEVSYSVFKCLKDITSVSIDL